MNKVISSNNTIINTKIKKECKVLLSAYNGEKFIKEQIDSIINQNGVDVRLVIRDDGSTDRTVSIIEGLQTIYPNCIELKKGNNVGIHRSFRELFLETDSSDYIAFADQDDCWDNNKLIVAISSMEKYNCDFYSCSARLVNENMEMIGDTNCNKAKYSYYMRGNSKLLTPGAQGCTIVLSKKAWEILKNRNYPDYYGHDTWLTVASYYLFDCLYDTTSYMSYRQHNNSATGNRTHKVKQFLIRIKQYSNGLSRYKQLANDIISSFSIDLSNDDMKVINAIWANETRMIDRIRNIKKYRFGKYGFLENWIYHLYYISGK